MLKLKIKTVEIGAAVLLLALGTLVLTESLKLGAGWGFSGPEPGFFPMVLTVLILVGAAVVLFLALRRPAGETFFEVSREIVELVKVGVPIILAVAFMRPLGLFIVAGLYIAMFMLFYGKFRWWWAAFAGVLFPLILWLMLRQAFNLAMPMSVFYRNGVLPF